MVLLLDNPIESLPGITARKAQILKKDCDIHTWGDLLRWYPFRYVDRTRFYTVSEIQPEMPFVQLKGRLEKISLKGSKGRQRLSCYLKDPTGSIELVWFQGVKWIEEKLKPGQEFIVFGKPSVFNQGWNIIHPELEPYTAEKASTASKLQAVYSSTEAMKKAWLDSRGIAGLIGQIFRSPNKLVEETLSVGIRERFKLISLEKAYRQIHLPLSQEELSAAQQRLKFEELFFLQLKLIRLNKLNKQNLKGYPFETIGPHFNNFYHQHLPFELTDAQKRVLREIRSDVAKPVQMNRLLQGDVGSGKTIVAFMSMLMAIDNGFQACIMAPTEILAQQHYQGLTELADRIGITIGLLTGSVTKKERTILHSALESGELLILVGTHALLEDKVVFKNLGLVVIDEQHRFGVAQRSRLWMKNELPPHILIMSATPIPRTLAMTLYGDLDISVIDMLPPGRKPILTRHFYERERPRVMDFIRKEISLGRQVYIVYPLIEESEQLDYRNLMEGYEHLLAWFPAPEYHLSIVHGKLKPADKEYEMQRFLKKQTQIMVATTVIEVGVNVPNASVMIIESAERFGLSQLHQLRGRVGRGADQSYCILMTSFKLSADARKRLQTMTETNDGFKIAEVDLELRGPGDLQGTRQSGLLDLQLADISRDQQLLHTCRELAVQILDEDPDLQQADNALLRNHLESMVARNKNWGRIS
jgi:ATP-dependent DNA helicase RecG